MFKVSGLLRQVFEVVQKTDTFRKRTFVLELKDRGFTEKVPFDLFNDHCSMIDLFTLGERVIVTFKLKGWPYTKTDGSVVFIVTLHAVMIARGVEIGDEVTQLNEENKRRGSGIDAEKEKKSKENEEKKKKENE